jgi:membrane-bound lytic murein transglycosylase MltF
MNAYKWVPVSCAAIALLAIAAFWPEAEPPAAGTAGAPLAQPDTATETPGPPAYGPLTEAFMEQRLTPDFEGMVERREVRVLVARSLTTYFHDGATQRGLTYDLFREFEKYLNRVVDTGNLDMHVAFVPVPRDQLIPALLDGRGDVAAANLTITPERSAVVDFSEPVIPDVDELLVTSIEGRRYQNLAELAGQEVHVRYSSSYYQSLWQLNEELTRSGYDAIRLVRVDEHLEDEDLLEMVNAGLIGAIVIDSHKARFWSQFFDDIVINEHLVLRSGGAIGWAYRKGSDRFAGHINRFLKNHRQGSMMGNILLRRYFENKTHVENALTSREMEKFDSTAELFKQYADRYGFDWLMLMAQAYQESRLDHSALSTSGAVGIMQVKPSTASDRNVGIDDVSSLENNIHAGTKYLRFIRDRYFDDPAIDATDRTLFAFAAYNAGPARIERMRRRASEQGLDPNRWFENVEVASARGIGREPVRYVRNIYKYYVAYKLSMEAVRNKDQARTQLL